VARSAPSNWRLEVGVDVASVPRPEAPARLHDLRDRGVIDPKGVTRLAVQPAAPVAAAMLTNEAIVAEELMAASAIAVHRTKPIEGMRAYGKRSAH
jgi:chaperonin GroEL (HSP60 family)